MYLIFYCHAAKKDYQKISLSSHKEDCLALLKILQKNPFQSPPPFKKIVDLKNTYSRRINIKHRLFYEVDEVGKRIKVIRMRAYCGDN
jgi:Txe/YoeB family toxin of toxin-antitoxin system